ncbi:MAG: hypothetical protein WBV94_09695 [Blastocatellia bacterium]
MKIHITRQSGTSLTDLIDRISASLRKTFRQPIQDEPVFYYPKEVFDDSVIACSEIDGKTYKIAWSIDGDEVKFGEPVEVTESYVEVSGTGQMDGETQIRQACQLTIRQSLDKEGWAWRFQVVGWGLSATRHIWRQEIFGQSLVDYEWENLGAFADHPTETQMRELPERSIQSKVGWWTGFLITEQGMDATLHIKPSADWLRQDLNAAYQAGNLDFYGASILVGIQAKQVTWTDQKTATDVERVKPISIDIVTTAAAKGRMKYALASTREQQEGEHLMNKKALLSLLSFLNKEQFESVRQSLVTGGAQGVTTQSTAEQVVEAIHGDEKTVEQAIGFIDEASRETTAAIARQAAGALSDTKVEADEIPFERMPLSFRRLAVSQAISNSDLPEAVRQSVSRKVTDMTTLAQVETLIETTRDALGIMAQAGLVDNPGVQVGADSADKISIGLAKAFGLSREEYNGIESSYQRYCRQSGGGLGEISQGDWNSADKLLSIQRLWIDLTGDRDVSGRGRQVQRITRQATWITSDFTELLSNVMHKRLLRDFRSLSPTWRRIATVKDVLDMKTQYAILIGEFGDLPTVAMQGDYLEPSALTDTQETYAMDKRGRVVSLAWETVVNDDLGGFLRVYGKLGRAAARTLLKFVWNTLFMANPTLAADSKALFHADHGNLITDALGTPGLKAAITALLNQTEPGSNEKMDVDTMNLTLAVAPGEYLNAQTLTDFNNAGGGEQDALAQLVRRMGITPVAVPFFTDANDWTLITSPLDREIVEIGFYQGNEEPEFFTQNDPTQGDFFGKDTVAKYKIRHVYGGAPVDFRGAVKSVVAD